MTEYPHTSSPTPALTIPPGEGLVPLAPIAESPEIQLGKTGTLDSVDLARAVDPAQVAGEAFIQPECLTKARLDKLRVTLGGINEKGGGLSNELARESLDIVRLATLEAIAELPGSGPVMKMLAQVAPFMKGPVRFGKQEHGAGATSGGDNSVAISQDALSDKGPILLGRRHFAYRQQIDRKLLQYMLTVAHEDGHVMGNGIGLILAGSRSFATSQAHLAGHPEQAMTGNWDADVRAHEERFAEGLGRMSLAKIMEKLGYGQDEIKVYLERSIIKYHMAGKKNANQIDHLDKADGRAGAHQHVPHTAPDGQKRAASLGYTKPLSPSEVLEALATATAQIEEAKVSLVEPDPTEWFHAVRTTKKESTLQAHLQQLQKERKRYRRLASLVGAVATERWIRFAERYDRH